MYGFAGKSINEIMSPLSTQILVAGTSIDDKTKELSPAFVTIHDAGKGLFTNKSANLDYRFIAIQTLAILSGYEDYFFNSNRNKVSHISSIGKRYVYDDTPCEYIGNVFNNQIRYKNMRMQISKGENFILNSNENVLDSIIFNIKTNVKDNLMYDIATYSIIQCFIADWLNMDVGKICYVSSSMQLDDENFLLTQKDNDIINEIWIPRLRNKNFQVIEEKLDLNDFTNSCHVILNEVFYMIEWNKSLDNFKMNYSGGDALSEYLNQFIRMIEYGKPSENIDPSDIPSEVAG